MNARLASLLVPLATIAFGIQAAHAAPAAKQDHPDILLIMADNLGYTDLGSFGGGDRHAEPGHARRHRGQDDPVLRLAVLLADARDADVGQRQPPRRLRRHG